MVFFIACKKEKDYTGIYNPTYVALDLPFGFPAMDIPEDNPFTEEGIELGRRLFYDPILSGDSTMSCESCHKPIEVNGETMTQYKFKSFECVVCHL